MTNEAESPNRAVYQALGILSVEYSRFDARLAHAVLFLDCNSVRLSEANLASKMLKVLSSSMFGTRLGDFKKLIGKIEITEETRDGIGALIRRLRRISVHRNDLLHGVWEGSSKGLGIVIRRRPGVSQPIDIQHWTAERIGFLYEAIHKETFVLDAALLRPEITAFRTSKGWDPYEVTNDCDKATVEAFSSTPLPAVNESLELVDKLAGK